MKRFRAEFQIFILRFNGLRLILRQLLLTAILIIIAYYLLPKPYNTWGIFDFLMKLSFSYFGALIFYFINIHIPKEEKKISADLTIWNNTLQIFRTLNFYYEYIKGERHFSDQKLMTEDEILEKFKKISPLSSLTLEIWGNPTEFNSHIDAFQYLDREVSHCCKKILHYYDLLPANYIKLLNDIDSSVNSITFGGKVILQDMTGYIYHYFRAYTLSIELLNIGQKFSKDFDRINNLKKI